MQSNLHLKPKVRWDIIAPSFKMNQTETQNKELNSKTKSRIQLQLKSFTLILFALFSLYGGTVKGMYTNKYTYQGKTLYYYCTEWDGDYGTYVAYVVMCDTNTSGEVIIPLNITYKDKTYKVVKI